MAVGTYQLPSPRAIDPPAGEFQLAGRSSNPDAFLLRFMGQRDLAQDDYGRELAAQHAFVVQQMMANVRNEQQARAIDLAKLPGGGGLLASEGNPLGASLSSDPGVLTNLAVAGDTAQGAKNWQAAATGLNQASQGGYQLQPGAPLPPGTPEGMSLTNLGPALKQAATIRAGAERDVAAIKAANTGGPSVSVAGRDPTTGEPLTVHYPGKWTQQQISNDLINNRGATPIDKQPGNLALPGTGLNVTSLPPATLDEGADPLASVPTAANLGTPTAANAQNAATGHAALQQSVNANLGKMPAAAQADIRAAAAKNGGQPVVGVDEQGPYALGAKGQKYR